MKISPIMSQICLVGSAFSQIRNNPSQISQRGEILSNLVTLVLVKNVLYYWSPLHSEPPILLIQPFGFFGGAGGSLAKIHV